MFLNDFSVRGLRFEGLERVENTVDSLLALFVQGVSCDD